MMFGYVYNNFLLWSTNFRMLILSLSDQTETKEKKTFHTPIYVFSALMRAFGQW